MGDVVEALALLGGHSHQCHQLDCCGGQDLGKGTMPADRLKVRDAAEDGYEVLEDGEPIWSFETIVEAVQFVRDRGARLWLDWGRTVIGGQTVGPRDFEPSFLGPASAASSASSTDRARDRGSGRSARTTSAGVSMAASEEGHQARSRRWPNWSGRSPTTYAQVALDLCPPRVT